ncbi:ABC transporter permease [Candidatus Marinamargulisbacteria bacterium SCGC AG-439-L15]|nr:ABC transporter permease [Candidatus Marinamargulisbacteria bacterium SCGC AG-439-L15]
MLKIQLVGLYTLVRKELTRILRIWPQTLVPPMITMSLYFLIFGNFIGSKIGTIQGVSYIKFIVPGLIMMAVITSAYANVASSVFGSKFQNNIEELLISPLSNSIILWGFLCGGICRSLIVGTLVTGVSLFFAPLQLHSLFIIIITMLLTSIFFSMAGFINALFANSFDDISIIPTFVLTPLTYLGGVFYSIKLLPDFWQTISLANPVLYIVNIFRYGFLGITDIPILLALITLVFFIFLMWGICLYLLKIGYGLKT